MLCWEFYTLWGIEYTQYFLGGCCLQFHFTWLVVVIYTDVGILLFWMFMFIYRWNLGVVWIPGYHASHYFSMCRTQHVAYSLNIFHFCLGSFRFESHPGHWFLYFDDFTQSLQINSGLLLQITPRPLPSTSFTIHLSLFILPLDAV